jgi:hypothetical protein
MKYSWCWTKSVIWEGKEWKRGHAVHRLTLKSNCERFKLSGLDSLLKASWAREGGFCRGIRSEKNGEMSSPDCWEGEQRILRSVLEPGKDVVPQMLCRVSFGRFLISNIKWNPHSLGREGKEWTGIYFIFTVVQPFYLKATYVSPLNTPRTLQSRLDSHFANKEMSNKRWLLWFSFQLIYWFIHPSNRYFLNAYCMQSAILNTVDSTLNMREQAIMWTQKTLKQIDIPRGDRKIKLMWYRRTIWVGSNS